MKSKIVKRVLAASLATVMTVSMAACGEEKPADAPASDAPVESDAPDEEVSPYTVRTKDDGSAIDLGGMEVIIRDWWSDAEGKRAEATDAYTEARNAYLEWCEETYNFTVKEMTISGWADVPADFANYAATGGDENYIFALRTGSELRSAVDSGLMYDVAKLNVFDMSEAKWTSSNIHKLYGKEDEVVCFRGIAAEARGGIYFNKPVLEEAGYTAQQLYDLQESGEWTWDKFVEILDKVQADTDNDGIVDRYGFCAQDVVFYDEAVASNYADFVGKENGQYVLKIDSEETLEALNWAFEVRNKYDASPYYPEDAAWDYFNTAWNNGRVGFFTGQAYVAGQMKTAGIPFDFGFLCFPKGPKASDYTNCLDDNVYAIPSCYDEEKAWKLAFVYDLYTEPVPGFENYPDWKSGYLNNFCDLESVELTIGRMVKNGKFTYHSWIPEIDTGNDFYWQLNKDNTPAQQAEAIKSKWQTGVDLANAK